MTIDIKELREKRVALIAEAREELDKITDDTPEAEAKEIESRFDAQMAESDKLKDRIDREERAAQAEKELNEKVETRAAREGVSKAQTEDRAEIENRAFVKWLKPGGVNNLDEEERAALHSLKSETRAQSVGTTTAGGFLVPEGFRAQLESAMKAFGGMRSVASILATSTGNDLPMPTSDDTSNIGAILAENTAITEQDITYGSLTLNAFLYTSKLVRVSWQLLQDADVQPQVVQDLASKLGERIARATNAHFTTGTGTAQPKGIVVGSTQGKVGATGQTTSITIEDLFDLQHSVDPAYRLNASWMMHDSTLKVIRKLKDANGQPILQPGITVGAPDTLLGQDFTINQDVAVMAANAKSLLYGAFSKYIIRDVLGVQLVRLQERYADFLQDGFFAYSRHDGDLLDAGTNPVKHYANSAT